MTETAEASPGALVFPLSKPQSECATKEEMWESSGCDLMKQPGEIANWLEKWQKTLPASAKVMIGNYTYLDGDLHVKLALCADYCIQRLRKARPSTGVAFLCTPTDIHVCTDASDAAARANYGSGFGSLGIEKILHLISGGKFLVPNFLRPVESKDGKSIKLVDGLSVAQGPNYALAKRMQHWRAQLEFEAGATVSSMVAPSTATISVIHNKTFAWAYGGMPYFKYEIFKQETTNAVMAAMLMHDTLNTAGPKNPANRKKFGIDNSLELFSTQGVHGGLWRSPYKVRAGTCTWRPHMHMHMHMHMAAGGPAWPRAQTRRGRASLSASAGELPSASRDLHAISTRDLHASCHEPPASRAARAPPLCPPAGRLPRRGLGAHLLWRAGRAVPRGDERPRHRRLHLPLPHVGSRRIPSAGAPSRACMHSRPRPPLACRRAARGPAPAPLDHTGLRT